MQLRAGGIPVMQVKLLTMLKEIAVLETRVKSAAHRCVNRMTSFSELVPELDRTAMKRYETKAIVCLRHR